MRGKCTRVHITSCLYLAFLFSLASLPGGASTGVQSNKLDRERGKDMLEVIKEDIQRHYYDPTFHGMNIEERFKTARDRIDQAQSNGLIFGIIAQALLDLNDSHTFFLPPQRIARTDYGWQCEMIGDRCFVIAVKPGSDAEAKGVKPGDEIVSLGGYQPVRDQLWKLKYLLYTLRPVPGVRLVLRDANGAERQVDIMSQVKVGKKIIDLTGGNGGNDIWDLIRDNENEDRLRAHRYREFGDDLFIWKMPEFDLSQQGVDDMIGKIAKRKALILDMRGNPGGSEETLLRLIGSLFDHDVKIGDLKRRKDSKPLIAKTRSHGFSGKLIVLVDSQSGSAAEVLARVVQLENRGLVLGDRSAGAVMRAEHFDHQLGTDSVIFYGSSITDGDIIMSDGKSLEKVGVTPDQVILPTAPDLYAKKDPVLSKAAEMAGVTIDPVKAGSMFPIEWRK